MQCVQHENSCLSHARFGLTQDVDSNDGRRNAFLLHLRRMLKRTIFNGLHELRLQQQVFEAGRVDARKRQSVVLLAEGWERAQHVVVVVVARVVQGGIIGLKGGGVQER